MEYAFFLIQDIAPSHQYDYSEDSFPPTEHIV